MTLEQAIEFCLNMEKEQYKSIHNIIRCDYPEYEATHHFRLASEYKQLAEWMRELKEAKRLLKLAIQDIYNKCGCENSDCDICANNRCDCDYDDRFTWKYKDEAFKILDKEDNNNG